MSFKLSKRSLGKLDGVHQDLVQTVKEAIQVTKVDFGCTYGVRSHEEQKKLYEAGRSQTMRSKHLPQADGMSHAVDLVAYVDGNVCWELNVYDDIADAMKEGAKKVGCQLKWGAAWHTLLTDWTGTSEELMMDYIDTRRKTSRRPFLDGPHFELVV